MSEASLCRNNFLGTILKNCLMAEWAVADAKTGLPVIQVPTRGYRSTLFACQLKASCAELITCPPETQADT